MCIRDSLYLGPHDGAQRDRLAILGLQRGLRLGELDDVAGEVAEPARLLAQLLREAAHDLRFVGRLEHGLGELSLIHI